MRAPVKRAKGMPELLALLALKKTKKARRNRTARQRKPKVRIKLMINGETTS